MADDPRMDREVFLFGLISPLLHLDPGEARKQVVEKILSTDHKIPGSKRSRISRSALYAYLHKFRKNGLNGLKRRIRSDKGTKKAVDERLLENAAKLRSENPKRSTRRIIRLLRDKPEFKHIRIALRTLSRHLAHAGLSRKEIGVEKKIYHPFEMPQINDLWQADASEGLWLPRQKKKTKLFAFLDDHSRICPHGQFYENEKLPNLEDCFKKAILKRGIPDRLYVDNGKVFVSGQFRRICAELGTRLIHHAPYAAHCKGKIERFFGTVKSDFYIEAAHVIIDSLDELNSFFWAYIDVEYHRREHSSIAATPLDRWSGGLKHKSIRTVEALEQIAEIFLWELKEKTINKSGEIRFQGNRYYVADTSLVNKRVSVKFDPFDLAQVLVYLNGRFIETASTRQLKRRTFNNIPENSAPSKTQVRKSAMEYLRRLKEHQREITKHDSPAIDYTRLLDDKPKKDDPS